MNDHISLSTFNELMHGFHRELYSGFLDSIKPHKYVFVSFMTNM